MLKKILSILILKCIFSSYKAEKICYDDLGCFINSPPFGGTIERLIGMIPQSPKEIGVQFQLFNRVLNYTYDSIEYKSISKNYLPNKPSKFIIHGFIQNGSRDWVKKMKNQILKMENVNVIVVDWCNGSLYPYEQAVSNALVVGAQISRLIKTLIDHNLTNASDFHLIGMSLGAHVAGYAGQRIKGLGRITGLDPAGPYFENTDPIVRLDPSDAVFVDVIHTDHSTAWGLGFGIFQPIGHVDFYVNGGFNQPKCAKSEQRILSGLISLALQQKSKARIQLICSHISAIYYFIDSIENRFQFKAYPCSSKFDFDNGNCVKCSLKGCNRMGYWASSLKDLGNLYLNTKSWFDNENLYKKNYIINLISSEDTKLIQAKGNFSIIFESLGKNSSTEILDDFKTTFTPGSNESSFVSVADVATSIDTVYIIYERINNLFSWLYDSFWHFKYIEVFSVENQEFFKFCSQNVKQIQAITKYTKC
ncbi:unnamed protein product [Brachionus calyciflorus]|uniref:Lipase domain-containing protein n=1 Tax=Brachionus calyciflorus TaxID=104777 RepID=A0A813NMQ4_9BILA|nr:unnamed protein product [Brachionus calyciflorus]